MGRPAHLTKSTIIVITAAVVLLIGGASWALAAHVSAPTPQPVPAAITAKPAATTKLTYQGQDGKTALELLKQHAKVQTKISDLGEFVTSINGNDGGGKKYWLYYVNGKEAEVGSGTYVTHNGEIIQWRLK